MLEKRSGLIGDGLEQEDNLLAHAVQSHRSGHLTSRAQLPAGRRKLQRCYEQRLTGGEVRELGGFEVLRSALRAAARSLGWTRVETYGLDTAGGEARVGVVDRREIAAEFADAVNRHREQRMRAAVETVARNQAEVTSRTVPRSGLLTAQEFRAALDALD